MTKQKANNPWLCQKCGTDCWGGISGLIGNAGKAKVYCLKHYNELTK